MMNPSKLLGKIVVFTNGCFDILHPGHISFLERARQLGDYLVLGLNSDASVRSLRGAGKPLLTQEDRSRLLCALRCVDEVIIFEEDTPARLIEVLQPDILVKGGDWPVEQIVGAETVLRKGGRVLSLPLLPGYSTTVLVQRILNAHQEKVLQSPEYLVCNAEHLSGLVESIHVKQKLLTECGEAIWKAGQLLLSTMFDGKKALFFGNGGSAADAQHIAAELSGCFEKERRALPALAITTNPSVMTSVSNDYGFENVFARQLEALANPGDVVVAISTGGNSPNVLAGVLAARKLGCKIIGLTGGHGNRLAGLCDAVVLVPSERTARIQEAHITIGHLWCEWIEAGLNELKEC